MLFYLILRVISLLNARPRPSSATSCPHSVWARARIPKSLALTMWKKALEAMCPVTGNKPNVPNTW